MFQPLDTIDNKKSILSIRGNVAENGMNRYFKRFPDGTFDLDDLKLRTEQLYEFLVQISSQMHFKLEESILVGYSNGANIIHNLLIYYPDPADKAVLIRPTLLTVDLPDSDLSGKKVLILAGKQDAYSTDGKAEKLKDILEDRKADVKLEWYEGGHELTNWDLEKAKEWIS